MEANHQSASRIRVPIAWKFFLLIGVVVPSVLAVSVVGVRAPGSMKQRLDTVYEDALNSARTVGQLSTAVEEAEEMSRLLVAQTQASPIHRTTSELRNEVMPRVQREIDQMHALAASDPSGGDLLLTERLQNEWQRFLTYTQSQTFLTAASGPSRTDTSVGDRLESLSQSVTATVGEIDAAEVKQANTARTEAQATYSRSLFLLRIFVVAGLLAGATAALWLTRDVVRRVRAYSTFAARVGSRLPGHPERGHRRAADDGDGGGGARAPQASPGALDPGRRRGDAQSEQQRGPPRGVHHAAARAALRQHRGGETARLPRGPSGAGTRGRGGKRRAGSLFALWRDGRVQCVHTAARERRGDRLRVRERAAGHPRRRHRPHQGLREAGGARARQPAQPRDRRAPRRDRCPDGASQRARRPRHLEPLGRASVADGVAPDGDPVRSGSFQAHQRHLRPPQGG